MVFASVFRPPHRARQRRRDDMEDSSEALEMVSESMRWVDFEDNDDDGVELRLGLDNCDCGCGCWWSFFA